MLTKPNSRKGRGRVQRLAYLLAPVGGAVLLGLLLALLVQGPVAASGGVVTNCANDADLSAKLAGGGNITFNCGNTHQAATIVLSSQKTITRATTIDGGGVITLSGGGLTRMFNVLAGAGLNLSNLTLEHGHAGSNDGGAISNDGWLVINAVTFFSNTVDAANNAGGAVFSDGALTVTNSSFLSNTADTGGAIETQGTRLFIGNTVFAGNDAVHDRGGAIENDFGVTTIVSGTFSGNSAGLGAGAIDSFSSGLLTISGSAFFNNHALGDNAGALFVQGPLSLTSSRIYSNTTSKSAGGLEVAGTATLDNVQVYGNQAQGIGSLGGGLFNKGNLTLTASSVSDNHAYSAAGLHNQGTVNVIDTDIYGNVAGGEAGGMDNFLNATLQSVRVYSNTAVFDAGGVKLTGPATLRQVDIYANSVTGSGGWGGGLDLEGTTPVDIEGARIYSNTVLSGQVSGAGAGIYEQDYYAPVTLSNSSVYSNVALTGPGGGIVFYSQSQLLITGSSIYANQAPHSPGGGIFAASEPASAALILVNSTLAGNSATQGGGLYNAVGNPAVALTNTTVTSNTAASGANLTGPVVAVNTIIAGGAPANCGNPITSRGHNLESGNSCGLHQPGDLTNTNPLLGRLQDNGGPTWTLLPGAGSPAIDHGDDAACPATDQRGAARPHGPHCDIGSVEVGPLAVFVHFYLPLMVREP